MGNDAVALCAIAERNIICLYFSLFPILTFNNFQQAQRLLSRSHLELRIYFHFIHKKSSHFDEDIFKNASSPETSSTVSPSATLHTRNSFVRAKIKVSLHCCFVKLKEWNICLGCSVSPTERQFQPSLPAYMIARRFHLLPQPKILIQILSCIWIILCFLLRLCVQRSAPHIKVSQ